MENIDNLEDSHEFEGKHQELVAEMQATLASEVAQLKGQLAEMTVKEVAVCNALQDPKLQDKFVDSNKEKIEDDEKKIVQAVRDAPSGVNKPQLVDDHKEEGKLKEQDGAVNLIAMKVFEGSPEGKIDTAVYDTLNCADKFPSALGHNVEDKRMELEGIVRPISTMSLSEGTVLEGGTAVLFEQRVQNLMMDQSVSRSVAALIAEAMREADVRGAR